MGLLFFNSTLIELFENNIRIHLTKLNILLFTNYKTKFLNNVRESG